MKVTGKYQQTREFHLLPSPHLLQGIKVFERKISPRSLRKMKRKIENDPKTTRKELRKSYQHQVPVIHYEL